MNMYEILNSMPGLIVGGAAARDSHRALWGLGQGLLPAGGSQAEAGELWVWWSLPRRAELT